MQIPLESIRKSDTTIPPVLHSMLLWNFIIHGGYEPYEDIGKLLRDNKIYISSDPYTYSEFAEKYGSDYCPFCDGTGTRMEEDLGYYYCICWLLTYREQLYLNCQDWGSSWAPKSLVTLDPTVGSVQDNQRMETAIATVKDWIESPTRWLVLSGDTGTGKTHMLQTMMTTWYPWSIYVVASDLENKLRKYLAHSPDLIGKFIDVLKYHPILILDDIGLEYEKAPWIAAKIDEIIEYRSREEHAWDFTTVIGTNIAGNDVNQVFARQGIPRTGSRISNKRIVTWLPFTGVDFRRKKS